MQGNLKNTLLGTIGILAIGTAVWQYFEKTKIARSDDNIQKKRQQISDEILINFLRDFRAQSYPHFFLVAGIIKRIIAEQNSEAVFQQILAKVKPEVELLFEKKQAMVLCKYELSKEEMQTNLELSTNQKVKELLAEFQQLYDDALEGRDPAIDLDEKTLRKFSQDEMIAIMSQILITSVEVICLAIEELIKSGQCPQSLKLDQPIFMKTLNNNGLADKKLAVLNSFGVCDFEDSDSCALEVFSKLTQYHKLQNPKFKQCVDDIETAYENIISKLLNRQIEIEEARTAAVKINITEIAKQLK